MLPPVWLQEGEYGPEAPVSYAPEELNDQRLTNYYGGQRAFVNALGSPMGRAARSVLGVVPGIGAVSTFAGLMQGPILDGLTREMAKRGLLADAFQAPEAGSWGQRDARAFDWGFYGYGANALNAPGGLLAGYSTGIFDGYAATNIPTFDMADAALPDFDFSGDGGDYDGGRGFDGGAFGDGFEDESWSGGGLY